MIVYPNADDLRRLFPHARTDILVPLCAALPGLCEKLALNTVLRVGHFLSQAGHEADGFATFEEYASGAAYEGRKDLGNTQAGDGRRFKGRGPIQLTGRDNYSRANAFVRDLLGRPTLDLLRTPGVVSTDRAVGLAGSLWFWTRNGLNAYADLDNAVAVSRGVNRGDPKSDKPAMQEAERIAITAQVLAMMRVIQSRATPTVSSPETTRGPAPPLPESNHVSRTASPPVAPVRPASFWARFFSALFRNLKGR